MIGYKRRDMLLESPQFAMPNIMRIEKETYMRNDKLSIDHYESQN